MSETSPTTSLPSSPPPVGVELASDKVILTGLHARLLGFLPTAGLVHLHLFDLPLVVTSAKDAIHGVGSKHYKGLAVDLRIKDLRPEWQAAFVLWLRVLADRYGLTVFDETNLPGQPHVHIEVAG